MKNFIYLILLFIPMSEIFGQPDFNGNFLTINNGVHLHLQLNRGFSIGRLIAHNDLLMSDDIFHGSYTIEKNVLILKPQDIAESKTFTLKIIDDFTLSAISVEGIDSEKIFHCDKRFFKNGLIKEQGALNNDGKKNGNWYVYDSTGKINRKQIFENGIMISDKGQKIKANY